MLFMITTKGLAAVLLGKSKTTTKGLMLFIITTTKGTRACPRGKGAGLWGARDVSAA
jgi:hypothetical protein